MPGNPLDQIKKYEKGDTLLAADVNALVEAARARNVGGIGWDSGGPGVIQPSRNHQQHEQWGTYDIPVVNGETTRIPPFSLVYVTSTPTLPWRGSHRGYEVKKYPASGYKPQILVVGRSGLGAPVSGNAQSGWASTLYNGGWVAYDDAADPNTTNSVTPLQEWGPNISSSSYLLTKNGGGFIPSANKWDTYKDYDGTTIKLVWAYQIPRVRAFIDVRFHQSLISTLNKVFYDSVMTHESIDWYLGVAFVGSPWTDIVLQTSGLWEYHYSARVWLSTIGSTTPKKVVVGVQPYLEYPGGSAITVGDERQAGLQTFTTSDGTFASESCISDSGIFNAAENDVFYTKVQAASTGSGDNVHLQGTLLLRRVDMRHYGTF